MIKAMMDVAGLLASLDGHGKAGDNPAQAR
jgi:hypothetical protein